MQMWVGTRKLASPIPAGRPVQFGLDKFIGLLTGLDRYLAPQIDGLVPGTAHQAMLAVGVVEILAGLLVAVAHRLGGYVAAAWLAGIRASGSS